MQVTEFGYESETRQSLSLAQCLLISCDRVPPNQIVTARLIPRMPSMRKHLKLWLTLLACICMWHLRAAPISNKCAICGNDIGEVTYIVVDKVTEEKKHI